MKAKFLVIFILSLIINCSNSSDDSSYYSKLLGKVRKEVIEQSLLYLPERTRINFLQMMNQMSNLKEKYSLTEVDSAYLIYKWIATNIELELTGQNDDPILVYNSGKGTAKGMSSLFKQMCNYCRLEVDNISGYIKTVIDLIGENLITKMDFTWNYILINGEYYLVDVSSGSGVFGANEYDHVFTDFYFGTNPEFFIRLHFPIDNKWQLLSDPISLEKFDSQAYLFHFFYMKKFKTISPDTKIITGSGKSKIQLTYDDSIISDTVMSLMSDPNNLDDFELNECKYSNGKIEINFNFSEKYTILIIGIHDFTKDDYFPIAFYQLKHLN